METASEPHLRKSVYPQGRARYTKAKLNPDSKYKCQENTGQLRTNNESQDQKCTFKIPSMVDFLVAQWYRILLPTQETRFSL